MLVKAVLIMTIVTQGCAMKLHVVRIQQIRQIWGRDACVFQVQHPLITLVHMTEVRVRNHRIGWKT